MKILELKRVRAERRQRRVRRKVQGTPQRPRLAVSRSVRHMYAQLIDDMAGKTLCAASTQEKTLLAQIGYGGNKKAAAVLGKVVGERAQALGIREVCFDRRGCRYHGRIQALADAAREAGLKF